MKAIFFAIILTLCSCATKERVVIERIGVVNLDSWQRLPWEYVSPVEIEVDAYGSPGCSKVVADSLRAGRVLRMEIERRKKENPDFNEDERDDEGRAAILAEKGIPQTVSLERVRWQIHPLAPVEKVARLTGRFYGTQRMEFWTSEGIFIVGAPNYGGRRLPTLGKQSIDLDYRVSSNGDISRNKEPWLNSTSRSQAARLILEDLDRHQSTGFQNIHFEFQPSSEWSEVVEVMGEIFPKLGGLRGVFFGEEKEGVFLLHIHDIWFNRKQQKGTGRGIPATPGSSK